MFALATPGDINNDGTVDVRDRDLLIDHLMGISELTGTALTDADANGDGVVDIRDVVFLNVSDMDADCLPDFLEALIGLDPASSDTDGNGIPDGDEDPDADGLTNCEEVASGTDPLSFDSDGDGFSDIDEVTRSSDPNDSRNVPIFDARSSALSYRFFGVQENVASTSVRVSSALSYRFFDAQGNASSSGIQFSAPLSYSFFDGAAASDLGLFVLSQALSYSF